MREPLLAQLRRRLTEITILAWDYEPDWDAVFDGADHCWCLDTSRAVAELLRGDGVACQVMQGGMRGNWHVWVTLEDGTIVDPTIDQYINGTLGHFVDAREVPWLTRSAQFPAPDWPDADVKLAVITPGHPLHSHYTVETALDQRH